MAINMKETNVGRLILKCVSKLQIPEHFHEFEKILIAIRHLNYVCNYTYLPVNYVQIIDEFCDSWYSLVSKHQLSTTPKIHIILDHLCDYFDETQITLKHITDE